MPIRVISFDVGETLLRPFPGFGQVVLDCCRKEGDTFQESREHAVEAYAETCFADLRLRGDAFSLSIGESRRVWTDIYRGFLLSENVPLARAMYLSNKIYARFLDYSTYRLFDDALTVLTELRARGYRLGVTSNWEDWLPGLLAAIGLAPMLDFQIISGEVGFEKPDRRVFAAMISAAQAEPSDILHVGDSYVSDVMGAREAGLKAILLDRAGRNQSADCPRVRSLSDLLTSPHFRLGPGP